MSFRTTLELIAGLTEPQTQAEKAEAFDRVRELAARELEAADKPAEETQPCS